MAPVRSPQSREEHNVALRLRPTDTSFYELFSISAQHLVTGAELLAEMVSDEADRHEVAKRMREAEHVCDENTHAIVRRVNSSFVTPFDREDIYALASCLDDVMDELDEAVDLILLYEVENLPAEVLAQVETIQRCAEITAEAMPKLRTMKDLDEYWIEINRLENDGDRAYRMLLVRLFSGEYDALTVLKMKEVADELEAACDAFEHVANTVETIAVKES
jgi:predicted phosphate transport protein (TIGR00153 family)